MGIFKDLEKYDNLKDLFDDWALFWEIPQKEMNTFYCSAKLVLRNIIEKSLEEKNNE